MIFLFYYWCSVLLFWTFEHLNSYLNIFSVLSFRDPIFEIQTLYDERFHLNKTQLINFFQTTFIKHLRPPENEFITALQNRNYTHMPLKNAQQEIARACP